MRTNKNQSIFRLFISVSRQSTPGINPGVDHTGTIYPGTIHPGLDFRIRVNKLAALAFIPAADVKPTFESLSTKFLHDELSLLAYFEKTLIGTPVGATRRLTPDFLIQMWNASEVGEVLLLTLPVQRLVGLPHACNAMIPCQHPSVWKFLDSLRNQQALTANTM